MNHQNKKLYIILFVLCFFVLLISVAFAALSTTLTINFGNVSQSVQTWNIHFASENIQTSSNTTITPRVFGTSDNGRSCGNATFSNNVLTIGAVTLSKPGDSCSWDVPIKNDGSIDAILSSTTWTSPTGGSSSCTTTGSPLKHTMVCNDITFSLAKCDDPSVSGYLVRCTNYSSISNTWTITGGGSYDVLGVTAEYNSSDVNTSSYTLTGAKVQFTFSQH